MLAQPATGSVPKRSVVTIGDWWMWSALALTALIGIVSLLPSEGLAQEAEKNWKVFRQDFRGRPLNEEVLQYTPAVGRQQTKEEPQGLRISVPGENQEKGQRQVGIATRFRLKEDFEITTSYEILQADAAATGNGGGVSLYIMGPEPAKNAVMVSNWFRPKSLSDPEGFAYQCEHNYTPEQGNRRFDFSTERFSTQAHSGKLRLVRRGSVVIGLVAEEGSDEFRELRRIEYGAHEVKLIRVAADTRDPNYPVEVRIHNFEIRAADIPPEAALNNASGLGTSDGSDTTPKSEGRGWLVAAELLGLAFTVTLAIALGAWLYRRQSRHAKTAPAPAVMMDAPPLSFSCACGKSLKAKAELVGKKVKCSQCGQPVLVPQTAADGTSRVSS
jgi:Protein of unknown function (DUF1583)